MNQVIVFPRGQLSASDKQRMAKVGIIAVEADHPHEVVSVMPTASMASADDLLMSAMAGTGASSLGPDAMFAELHRRIKAKEQP